MEYLRLAAVCAIATFILTPIDKRIKRHFKKPTRATVALRYAASLSIAFLLMFGLNIFFSYLLNKI